jgi:hypothetical protein
VFPLKYQFKVGIGLGTHEYADGSAGAVKKSVFLPDKGVFVAVSAFEIGRPEVFPTGPSAGFVLGGQG